MRATHLLSLAVVLIQAPQASAFGGQASVCKTTGGTGHGAACVFPFTFGGKTYTTCTTVGNGHTPWCATSTAGGENGPWGNCNTKLLACRRGHLRNKGIHGCSKYRRCGKCQGDCDSDHDCVAGLRCFQRNDKTPVPGCASGGRGDRTSYDFCAAGGAVGTATHHKASPHLVKAHHGCSRKSKCRQCAGDCDSDGDCATGLKCFQRNGKQAVPGCAAGGSGDVPTHDYCIVKPPTVAKLCGSFGQAGYRCNAGTQWTQWRGQSAAQCKALCAGMDAAGCCESRTNGYCRWSAGGKGSTQCVSRGKVCALSASSTQCKAPADMMFTGRRFAATLGAKNGVPAASYVFMKVKGGTRGSYSSIMIKACKRYGMKPVCDYPQSCKNDRYSLYIGQSQFLASPRYRNNNGLVPSGFSKIRKAWTGVCSYVRGNARALCNRPRRSHSWRTPTQFNPGFICGKRLAAVIQGPTSFTATLGGMNGVRAGEYRFRVVKTDFQSGSYSSVMVKACTRYGMKPVCGGASWCRRDKAAIYIGQKSYTESPAYWKYKNYMPTGFSAIAPKFAGLCSYSGTANGNSAFCNAPATSASWKSMDKYNPGFMCAKKVGDVVTCRDNNAALRKIVPGASCRKAKAFGMCTSAAEKHMALTFCAKTCGVCPSTHCVDRSSHCPELAMACGGGGLVDTTCCATCSHRTRTGKHRLTHRGQAGCTAQRKCKECQGDCDSDSDCGSGLKCFQRYVAGVAGSSPVPGCTSGGGGDVYGNDYCYNPTAGH